MTDQEREVLRLTIKQLLDGCTDTEIDKLRAFAESPAPKQSITLNELHGCAPAKATEEPTRSHINTVIRCLECGANLNAMPAVTEKEPPPLFPGGILTETFCPVCKKQLTGAGTVFCDCHSKPTVTEEELATEMHDSYRGGGIRDVFMHCAHVAMPHIREEQP